VAIAGLLLLGNLFGAMDRRGLSVMPGFLETTAGFEIAETSIDYTPTDTYGRALLVGLVNTIAVSIVGIVLSTILGVALGIARLSQNWLLARLTAGYVEIFRNTPLLVQLLVLYFAVFLQLPAVRDSLTLGELVFLNQRGVMLPRPIAGSGIETFLAALLGAAILALGVVWLGRRRRGAGRPARWTRPVALLILITLPLLAWLALPAAPLTVELPERGTFNIRGGLSLSPELGALLVGLTLYTSAFIAEIVRGGITAVPHGQVEAARALGLSEGVVMRRVILPQALRVIVPPLTSQYLNLLKNSSLAIAIGYPDLFNVSTTVANQTGQPVAVMVLVMVVYLVLSLIGSAIMNVVNRRVQLPER
jgi:general L-amino acid transport system permease protein